MKVQQLADITRFLRTQVESLNDEIYGQSYRAAVYLHNGTFLPCVIFRNPKFVVQLAIKRFSTTEKAQTSIKRGNGMGYSNMVQHFKLNKNRLNPTEIKSIRASSYAFPLKYFNRSMLEALMVGQDLPAK